MIFSVIYAKILLNIEIIIFQWNFVSLRVDMKDLLTKCAAAVLVLWYSLSVIGFDVHTCSGSGRTFIATVISGTGCEDIHPEHNAPSCSCCQPESHEDGRACGEDLRTKPCCTDDWQAIVLTGVRVNEKDQLSGFSKFGYIALNHALVQESYRNLNLYSNGPRIFYRLASGSAVARSCQEIYGVWRI